MKNIIIISSLLPYLLSLWAPAANGMESKLDPAIEGVFLDLAGCNLKDPKNSLFMSAEKSIVRQIGVEKWQFGADILDNNPELDEYVVSQQNWANGKAYKYVIVRPIEGPYKEQTYLNDELVLENDHCDLSGFRPKS